MVGIINAGEYGRAIHDAWLRRQLIDIGETVVNNAFGADPELDGAPADRGGRTVAVPAGHATAAATAASSASKRALTKAIKGAERAFRRAGHVTGLTTGLRDLDSKTGRPASAPTW